MTQSIRNPHGEIPSTTTGRMRFSVAVWLFCLGFLLSAPAGARELTPRELYNQGAQSLEKGYLREAESCLLRATASNFPAQDYR